MTARFRALESERPDALFQDPYAERLAGEKGRKILSAIPGGMSNAWTFVVRTHTIDARIQWAVAQGIRKIVNLASGLDTRPYRLKLPKDLLWVDVDLPGVIEYKQQALQGSRPTCKTEYLSLDLKSKAERDSFFASCAGSSTPTLVITEGLLLYLAKEEVDELARAFAATPPFHYWVTDILSTAVLAGIRRDWDEQLTRAKCPIQFAPPGGAAYFEGFGWRTAQFFSYLEEARRLRREAPRAGWWRLMRLLSTPKRRAEFRQGGIVLLQREGR